MTQSEYEAELHFQLCKSIFATLGAGASSQKMICTLYSVPLWKNTMHQLANWR